MGYKAPPLPQLFVSHELYYSSLSTNPTVYTCNLSLHLYHSVTVVMASNPALPKTTATSNPALPLVALRYTPDRPISLFENRFMELYENLSATYMSATWMEELADKTPREWFEIISCYTVPGIKQLLNEEEALTIELLLAQPWMDTRDAGVYLNILATAEECHTTHIYVGSGTRYDKGLKARRANHDHPKILSRE